MVNHTVLFKAVLDVVMANSQWNGEKAGYPVQFYSLPAGLHQQAANTLVSFLKLYMIKTNIRLCCYFFHLYQLLCERGGVRGCKYAPVFVCTLCIYVGKWCICVFLCVNNKLTHWFQLEM